MSSCTQFPISNVYLVKGGVTGCARVLVWDLGTCCHSLFLCYQSVFYLSSNGYCEKSQRKQFSIKVIVNPRSSSTLLLPWCKYLWSLSACTWVGVRITKYLKGGLVDEPIQEVYFFQFSSRAGDAFLLVQLEKMCTQNITKACAKKDFLFQLRPLRRFQIASASLSTTKMGRKGWYSSWRWH